MHYPAPRTCQLVAGVTAAGLVAVDVLSLAARRRLLDPNLHQVVVGAAAVFGAAGLVGAYIHESVQLGRRMEQTRQRHARPSATVTTLPVPYQRRAPRRRADS
ncbi:hypothetical protein AB0N38_10715 [Micromonospora aurantiaca]|uniref:hypothetical protein n=1 Tax=Micromonospora aurantiaca (nom. illeg.) TaxID=47850 RepID=UPI003433931C